ncbi:MAG: MBL fold metallo-hydrolase [Candidatus Nanohaloarchaeota archaeon QJJ-5]|nr:MBL fold metallo-hydrolase [Candidatus Nanohaloarchaeota archaeon QJJ-5]
MTIENLAADTDTFTSNVYLIDEKTLIDAGSGESIVNAVPDDLSFVVITHSHDDHIDNLEAIIEMTNATVFAYNPDALPVDANRITDGDSLRLGPHQFSIYHTPGHKDDSICLYRKDHKQLFSGDLIFPDGSFGRTDLDEGDRDTLIESIERITALDVAELYPGHDEPTTIEVNEQIEQSLAEARKHEPKY